MRIESRFFRDLCVILLLSRCRGADHRTSSSSDRFDVVVNENDDGSATHLHEHDCYCAGLDNDDGDQLDRCAETAASFRSNHVLLAGELLCSDNGRFRFGPTARGGLLVLCDAAHGVALWSQSVELCGFCVSQKRRLRLTFDPTNGSLNATAPTVGFPWTSLLPEIRSSVWDAGTIGNPGARLVVREDGLAGVASASSEWLWTTDMVTTASPTTSPSARPSAPTAAPSPRPSDVPSPTPTNAPTAPTAAPSRRPSSSPTTAPTAPTPAPSPTPSGSPTNARSDPPTAPTNAPSPRPSPRPQQYRPLVVYVMGDTPYNDHELVALRSQVDALPSDASLLLHVGDVMNGRSPCATPDYQRARDALARARVPVIVSPGDNDVNDCPDFGRAWGRWRDVFVTRDPYHARPAPAGAESFVRQSGTANYALETTRRRDSSSSGGGEVMLVVGVDLVGGAPHDANEWKRRHATNLAWTKQRIAHARRGGVSVRGLLLVGHARPTSRHADYFEPLRAYLDASGVPVNRALYVHGDGHYPDDGHAVYGIRCLQVDKGAVSWARLVLDFDGPLFPYRHVVLRGSLRRERVVRYENS